MIHGLDTGVLVAAGIVEHDDHATVRDALAKLVATGDFFAIAPQVLAEFVQVVTDPRRFAQPLGVTEAIRLAEPWWTARETVQVFPNDATVGQFLSWLKQFSLGRKRLLDTLLASTYSQAGAGSILTTNPSDFALFGVFTFAPIK